MERFLFFLSFFFFLNQVYHQILKVCNQIRNLHVLHKKENTLSAELRSRHRQGRVHVGALRDRS